MGLAQTLLWMPGLQRNERCLQQPRRQKDANLRSENRGAAHIAKLGEHANVSIRTFAGSVLSQEHDDEKPSSLIRLPQSIFGVFLKMTAHLWQQFYEMFDHRCVYA